MLKQMVRSTYLALTPQRVLITLRLNEAEHNFSVHGPTSSSSQSCITSYSAVLLPLPCSTRRTRVNLDCAVGNGTHIHENVVIASLQSPLPIAAGLRHADTIPQVDTAAVAIRGLSFSLSNTVTAVVVFDKTTICIRFRVELDSLRRSQSLRYIG